MENKTGSYRVVLRTTPLQVWVLNQLSTSTLYASRSQIVCGAIQLLSQMVNAQDAGFLLEMRNDELRASHRLVVPIRQTLISNRISSRSLSLTQDAIDGSPVSTETYESAMTESVEITVPAHDRILLSNLEGATPCVSRSVVLRQSIDLYAHVVKYLLRGYYLAACAEDDRCMPLQVPGMPGSTYSPEEQSSVTARAVAYAEDDHEDIALLKGEASGDSKPAGVSMYIQSDSVMAAFEKELMTTLSGISPLNAFAALSMDDEITSAFAKLFCGLEWTRGLAQQVTLQAARIANMAALSGQLQVVQAIDDPIEGITMTEILLDRIRAVNDPGLTKYLLATKMEYADRCEQVEDIKNAASIYDEVISVFDSGYSTDDTGRLIYVRALSNRAHLGKEDPDASGALSLFSKLVAFCHDNSVRNSERYVSNAFYEMGLMYRMKGNEDKEFAMLDELKSKFHGSSCSYVRSLVADAMSRLCVVDGLHYSYDDRIEHYDAVLEYTRDEPLYWLVCSFVTASVAKARLMIEHDDIVRAAVAVLDCIDVIQRSLTDYAGDDSTEGLRTLADGTFSEEEIEDYAEQINVLLQVREELYTRTESIGDNHEVASLIATIDKRLNDLAPRQLSLNLCLKANNSLEVCDLRSPSTATKCEKVDSKRSMKAKVARKTPPDARVDLAQSTLALHC